MNPNYSEFKFPHIKGNSWAKIFSNKKTPSTAIDMISKILSYDPKSRPKPLVILQH